MSPRFAPFSQRCALKGLLVLAAIGLTIFLYLRFWPWVAPLGPPAIISRAEWGAEPPDSQLQPPASREVFNTVVVHHSAMMPYEGPLEIQYAHMRERGFMDIGYHFVLDGRGRIYEGRNLAVHGAHVREHNAGTLGIVLMGNYEELTPSAEQLDRLKWLVRRLMQDHPLTHLAGHSDFLPGKTLCPGKNVEPLLPALAAELGLRFGSGGYVGPEPASAAPTRPVSSAVAAPAPVTDPH
ncbi:MAG: N-acetylmuramoyl-L-alanine amidase [Candidatus Competibacteraceae bacterium]|nr:N-acetylmuramoyl-L-alanine amidase [Candidatus Competibacteraceae bacterium]